jgi:hypothetical protein
MEKATKYLTSPRAFTIKLSPSPSPSAREHGFSMIQEPARRARKKPEKLADGTVNPTSDIVLVVNESIVNRR